MTERWEEFLSSRLLRQAQAMFDHRLESYSAEIAGRCESPIERLFITQFLFLDWQPGYPNRFDWQIDPACGEIDSFRSALQHTASEATEADSFGACWGSWTGIVAPQVQIGRYRVDFLFGASFCDKIDPLPERYLVVECDGHEFHEKTKAQAERDKKRDRDLQAAGFAVYRFTGSQIYRDPQQCGDDVLAFFDNWSAPYLAAFNKRIGIAGDGE